MPLSAKSAYAPLPSTTRGKSVFLGGDPKGNNFVYTTGNNVIVRNINNPLLVDFYLEHARAPTVAAYAPSGNYIASGDSAGQVRIWDTINAEHILKIEVQAIAGEIRDIAWTGDSSRVVAVGDGRESFAKAFSWDSGTNVGTIERHEKRINTCAARPGRPFRVVTGSEDCSVNWYEGPPFKFKSKITAHSRFVNCVRYAPNGNVFATCGSDKKVFLYEGKDATPLGEFAGHDGGVYALCFNPDSTRLLTASADRTCRIWDVTTQALISTFQLDKTVENQQLGCLWQGPHILGVGLDGIIRYFDENSGNVVNTLYGHQVFTTAVAYDNQSNSLISTSYDSKVTRWDEATGQSAWIAGAGHTNSIQALAIQGDVLVSGGMDDSIQFSSLSAWQYSGAKVATDGPVNAVAASQSSDLVVGTSINSIYVVRGQQVASATRATYGPRSVAISPDDSTVLVGGDDRKLHVYTLNGANLVETSTQDFNGDVENVAFSPNGDLIAVADRERFIKVFKRDSFEQTYQSRVHTARVLGIAFSPDSARLATVSQDARLVVHSFDGSARQEIATHRMGANNLVWINNVTIATVGQDAALRTWSL